MALTKNYKRETHTIYGHLYNARTSEIADKRNFTKYNKKLEMCLCILAKRKHRRLAANK
jgi:hypothetical protein